MQEEKEGVFLKGTLAGGKEREREESIQRGMQGDECKHWVNWAVGGLVGIAGIQMGKTPLCTDAAEPVAGGAAADKYVSGQHHAMPRHTIAGPPLSVVSR